MNKENAVSKINKIGKAGTVISTLLKVVCIMGIVAAAIFTIFSFCIPEKIAHLNKKTQAELVIDLNELELTESEKASDFVYSQIKEIENTEQFSVNDTDFSVNEITYDDECISVNMETKETAVTSHSLAYLTLTLCLMCINALIIIIFIRRLFLSLKICETPFEENVIKKMKALAICLIPTLYLNDVFKSAINFFTFKTDTIDLGINIVSILIVLIVFTLVSIFKYGAVLQQESDETL